MGRRSRKARKPAQISIIDYILDPTFPQELRDVVADHLHISPMPLGTVVAITESYEVPIEFHISKKYRERAIYDYYTGAIFEVQERDVLAWASSLPREALPVIEEIRINHTIRLPRWLYDWQIHDEAHNTISAKKRELYRITGHSIFDRDSAVMSIDLADIEGRNSSGYWETENDSLESKRVWRASTVAHFCVN